ncbi:lipocalin family protein [Thalassotalea litorea]|uniref:lipocalin family protein n=1 Tax=Thalassotalea litorea TaxID=2020715 RepID=UPI001FE508FB|nr:lipocalin family protein [Thalassotalea litorea]
MSLVLLFNITSCTSIPQGVEPVKGFELSRYLGTWYEVARLDHSFERGLEQVTARYSLDDNGDVVVENKGFDSVDREWSSAEGKAKFVGSENTGHLKVSFFGPFYSSYVISHLKESSTDGQEAYQTAYVIGYETDYVWMLSRTPAVTKAEKQDFIRHVEALGVDADELIWVQHPSR